MRLEFAPDAILKIREIHSFIASENPIAADKLRLSILEKAGGLPDFPEQGRVGEVQDTRELVLVGAPYVLIYEIGKKEQIITVLNIWHSRQSRR